MKYFRPTQVSEAAAAIANGALPLAGGTVVVPNIAANGGRKTSVVDISRIAELAQTRSDGNFLTVGALTSLAHIGREFSTHSGLQALSQAAVAVGNPQVRRAATIGGNVALGIGIADLVPALCALDAEVLCYSGDKQQIFSLADFAPGGRLITGIKIPLHKHVRSGFRKFAWRGASGITIVNLAIALHMRDKRIETARVVTGGLQAKPQRLLKAEGLLEQSPFLSEMGDHIASTAAAEAKCDLAGPPGEQYRRRVLEFIVKDTLIQLMD
jgi:CO/xanthine dehydrogenase FAD-binding subunit